MSASRVKIVKTKISPKICWKKKINKLKSKHFATWRFNALLMEGDCVEKKNKFAFFSGQNVQWSHLFRSAFEAVNKYLLNGRNSLGMKINTRCLRSPPSCCTRKTTTWAPWLTKKVSQLYCNLNYAGRRMRSDSEQWIIKYLVDKWFRELFATTKFFFFLWSEGFRSSTQLRAR